MLTKSKCYETKKITKQELANEVAKGHCPAAGMFCTVATTGYEKAERIRMCTRCWEETMREYHVKIIRK